MNPESPSTTETPSAPETSSAPASQSTTTSPSSEPRAAHAPWPDRLREVVLPFGRWLARPRVRLTLTGVILLLLGGLFVTSSVWTLPLVIAGALMVAIAWVGHRLDGRLAVEWGEGGTQLEFRAQIKAADSEHPALPEASPGPRRLAAPSESDPEPEDADVVEGEAHTVEIEVAELKALIAAAETAEAAEITLTDAREHAALGLRVAGGDARAGESGR
jgi:hypothetical protein